MFQFKIQFLDEINHDCIIEEGLISADSYIDTMKKLIDYFGDEIVEVSMCELEDILVKDDLSQILKLG